MPSLCDQISDGLLVQPVSGLAWQALPSAGVKPFWQSLYDGNALDEPLMAFYLTVSKNVTGADEQESGGVFILDLSHHQLSELIMPP